MAVRPILPAPGTPVRPDPAEISPSELLASLEPEHKEQALLVLRAFSPELFDFLIRATEPDPLPSLILDDEPYCTTCGHRVGVFPTKGDGWRHYRGDGITHAEPFPADHNPVIAWRTPPDPDSDGDGDYERLP
jgi:hypothetical protein